MLKYLEKFTDKLTAKINTGTELIMNESTFTEYLVQRIETHFPCENPMQVYESMLAQAKEMYPEAEPQMWKEWVVFGLINEFDDKTLDFIYYSFTTGETSQSVEAA